MKIRTRIQAGKIATNHNQKPISIRTAIPAGKLATNHSQSKF